MLEPKGDGHSYDLSERGSKKQLDLTSIYLYISHAFKSFERGYTLGKVSSGPATSLICEYCTLALGGSGLLKAPRPSSPTPWFLDLQEAFKIFSRSPEFKAMPYLAQI